MKRVDGKKKQIKLTLIAAAAVLGGVLLYKFFVTSPQVALIQNSQSVCVSNIASFTTTDDCGDGKVKRVDYTCTVDDKKGYEGDGVGNCVDPRVAFEHAQLFCGQTCTAPATPPYNPTSPTPSPRICGQEYGSCMTKTNTCLTYTDSCAKSDFCITPFRSCETTSTWPPTPPPTSDPSPLVSCAIEVYKLPTDKPMTLSREYLVRNSRINAKSGERYAFAMRLTNIKKYPLNTGLLKVTAWTENVQGASAPYTIFSADANNCSTGFPDKSVRCEIPNLSLGIRETSKPDIFAVVDIDKVARRQNTSLTYKGIYSASTITCPKVNLTVMPDPVRKCYGVGKVQWCRNVVPQ